MKRRTFLPRLLASFAGTITARHAFSGNSDFNRPIPTLPQPDAEDFWEQIRAQYRTGDIINLNNGGVSPHPLVVEEAFFNYHRICNEVPSYSMWRVLEKMRDGVRLKLAEVAHCPAEEIATNRNATEALVTVIMGLPLRKGDEVIVSKFDYPRMMNAWKLREERDGIVLRWIDSEQGSPTEEELVERYLSPVNSRTSVIHLTHMINWTGRIVPVKRIIDKIKKDDITTIVDAAHSFAHIPFSIPDLGCDYLGASLHKWLGAPFGNGLLYVKKDNIEKLPSLFPVEKSIKKKIEKFEELGTRNNAAEFAISQAVDFYRLMGADRKYNRLVELRNHWVDQVKHLPKVRIITPLSPGQAGAIALFAIEGKGNNLIEEYVSDRYRIHCIGIEHEGVSGIRISPNVYTSKRELDVLAGAIQELAGG